MKIKLEDLSMQDLGCVCFVTFFTTSKEMTGHSQRFGIEESDVSYIHNAVGILTGITEKEIILSCCMKIKYNPMTYGGAVCEVSTKVEEKVSIASISNQGEKLLYLNIDEISNSIEQHVTHILKWLAKHNEKDSQYTRALRRLTNYAQTLKEFPPRK